MVGGENNGHIFFGQHAQEVKQLRMAEPRQHQRSVCRVIAGEFGNGEARRAALGSRYDEVQAEVNRILAGGSSAPAQPAAPDVDALARAVIRGDYGNGDARRAALGANYDAV